MQLAKSLKVQNLSVYTDSELIFKQIRNVCQTKHSRLRAYRNEVWDSVENFFDAFNLTHIPRDQNIHADAFAVSTSSFKIPDHIDVLYQIQVKYRPSIPNNLKHWQIFEDDEHLKSFLQVIDNFSFLQIDEDSTEINENTDGNDTSNFKTQIANHDIIQLSNNFIPKGLIPLEKLFDQMMSSETLSAFLQKMTEEINIGTDENIKNIKICASLDPEIKAQYLKLLQNYKDVFAWTYVDLKTYDTSLIQRKIH